MHIEALETVDIIVRGESAEIYWADQSRTKYKAKLITPKPRGMFVDLLLEDPSPRCFKLSLTPLKAERCDIND